MQPDKTLARLSKLVDYEVAHGQPDVRGWKVKTADDEVCGTVEDLVIDTEIMQVCYLDVWLAEKTPESNDENHVLIPLGDARLDDHNDDVLLNAMTGENVATLPHFRAGAVITPDATHTPHADDETRFYGARASTGGALRRSTLSEEQPILGDGKHTPTK